MKRTISIFSMVLFLLCSAAAIAGDRDGDGIEDADDLCPAQPEDLDGVLDDDGCPDVSEDKDKDGVSDADDACPYEPEDVDAFEDEDGCPEPDNDGDKIADLLDQCTMAPEDYDDFDDHDGCPDPDNDQDGILDVDDKCPNDAEDIDGKNDEDGCPDLSVRVTPQRIEINTKIYFEFDKAVIKPVSFDILERVAEALNDHPELQVRIEGHTDNAGEVTYNQKLSHRRALAVLEFLVEHGVAEERLTAVGLGETVPLSDDAKPSDNRRVEFHVVQPE